MSKKCSWGAALQHVQNSMSMAKKPTLLSAQSAVQELYTCITRILSLSRWGREMLKAVKMSRIHDPGWSMGEWAAVEDVLQFAPATFTRVRCSKQTFQRCVRSQFHWPVVTKGSTARERSRGWGCLPGCFFCLWAVSWGPRRQACQCVRGQQTWGLEVKQADTGLFCPLFDPAARDPCLLALFLPFTLQ